MKAEQPGRAGEPSYADMAEPVKRKVACVVQVLLAITLCVLGGQQSTAQVAATRQPVLVELFTSEGCSDCPPADALLALLDATQFVPGVDAIVLSEHVTYWDRQGWRDPFSLQEMTDRQAQYVARFGLKSAYTPQMVVDGGTQFVGNNPHALSQALEAAGRTKKLLLMIEDARWTGRSVRFAVRGQANPNVQLTAALAEDATRSEVKRGENAGRTLHHVAVVRAMKDFGTHAMDGRTLELHGSGMSADASADAPVRLVVFLTDRNTGRVEAVAEQTLKRSSGT